MSRFVFTQNEAEFLCNVFDIGKLRDFKEFPSGLINTSVECVASKGKYVLRVYNHKHLEQVLFEVDVLHSAASCGLPVPNPLASVNGEYIVLHKGKCCLTYSYLPGESPARLSLNQVGQIGDFLGRFHKCVEGFQPRGKRESLNLEDFRTNLEEYIRVSTSSDLPAISGKVDWLSKKVSEIDLPLDLPGGYIHVDVKPENLLFAGENLTGVLDFDNGFLGPFILDVGKTLMWCCCFERKKFDKKSAEVLLSAYSKHRQLASREKEFLFNAFEFAFISHVFRDFYLYSKGIIPRKYIDGTVFPMLKLATNLHENREDFEEVIT